METGGSSESPVEPKKGKSKTPRKPKESVLKQKSPAEFFAENKNIAGFDNPGKCLYTTVRELVENSLDSAESISELPVVEITIEEIDRRKFNSMIGLVHRDRVDEALYDDYESAKAREKRLAKEAKNQEIQAKNAALGKKIKEPTPAKGMKSRGEASFYRVTCKDNGKGMPHDDIPNMFGRVLSGTKYGLKQTRGKFGLGAKMALIWSKMSTGLPIEISSSMKGQNFISFCRLDIDIHRNVPHIYLHEKRENKEKWHGAQIEVVIEGNWTTYRSKILHYMRQMAVITPYAQFLFKFISDTPDKSMTIKFAPRTDVMPPVPLETKHHPSSVDLLLIKRLIAETSKQNLLQFLQHEFVNIGKPYAERLIGEMGPDFSPKMAVKSLTDQQIVRIHQLFRQAKFDDPSGEGDVRIMKEMGLDAYRFSISWPRVLPKGKLSGGVNKKAIEYYNKLINELLAHGIQPYVTLFHWDLPQALEDEYGGFLSPLIVDDFRDYAGICFKEFGDRVKHWITLNEPWSYSKSGYNDGQSAPGRCSEWKQLNCTGGDSATEPYLTGHNQLLAHSAAVKLYREKFQASQNGKIGITLNSNWFVPYTNATHNRNAAIRAMDFMLGWFMDPIVYGYYPRSMCFLAGARLPKFSIEQAKMVKGSFDFIGLNYYTANYAHYASQFRSVNASYGTDSLVNLTTERNGVPIGPQAGSEWLYVYPKGIYNLLMHVKHKYGNPLMYITENGVSEVNNPTLPLEQQLDDPMRIDYYYRHLWYLRKAIEKGGLNVKGYFAWSLLDNFEWFAGYTVRFGFNYVDYKNGLKRYPKSSSLWFRKFLENN